VTERAVKADKDARGIVARVFTWVEDVVYVGLGILLAIGALLLLGSGAIDFARSVGDGHFAVAVISLLDRLLLTLMLVELLYTVQVSFREHTLVPEPFLLVGLVAATRRILVLTAELGDVKDRPVDAFRASMTELGVLTIMIVAFVACLLMLRNRRSDAVASRV
jgi:phosphate-starvation-inducible protein E